MNSSINILFLSNKIDKEEHFFLLKNVKLRRLKDDLMKFPFAFFPRKRSKKFRFIHSLELLNAPYGGVRKDGTRKTFNESFSCLKMIDDLQLVSERMDGNISSHGMKARKCLILFS